MRNLILKLLVVVVPVGLTIVGTNYLIDPANIFSATSYVEGIAGLLSQGHNVDNVSNYDERLLQEQMIKKNQETPAIVVLGSSRVMEIGGSFFPGKKVMNCGVSHGNVNDLIALVGAWDSLMILPHEMIIGVDPWLLGQEATTEWQSLYPYHQYLVKKYFETGFSSDGMQSPNPFRKVSNLIALNYFQSSLQFVLKGKSNKYKDVGQNKPQTYGRFADGTVCYSEVYTHPDRAKLAIDSRVTGYKDGLPLPDSSKIKLLEGLLEFLQQKNIQVHLIKIPVHPSFYKAVQQKHNQLLQEWDPIFSNIATKYHLSLSGSFSADSVGMPETDFYDTYHCSGEAIKKYISIR